MKINTFVSNALFKIKNVNDGFTKNILIVLFGSIIIQLISIAILPLLTRLTDKRDIALYFVWIGISNVLAIAGTARLDMAMFVVRTKQEVLNLLRLIFLISLGVGLLFFLIVDVVVPFLGLSVGNIVMQNYVFALAAMIPIQAVTQGVLSYVTYNSQFVKLSLIKLFIALALNIGIFFVSFGGGDAALIIKVHLYVSLLTLLISLIYTNLFFELFSFKIGYSFKELWVILKKNYRFPFYSMPSDLISTYAAQLPLFILLVRFGSVSVAFYAMTLRILAGPIGLLANSVLTAFKDEAGKSFREKGNCLEIFIKTFKLLTFMAIIPFAVLLLFAPQIFAFFLGSEWNVSGEYARLLIPMFFLKFIISPLSYTLYIAQKQLHDFIWQVFILLMTFVSFTVADSVESAILCYSLGYSFLYLVYFWLSYESAKNKNI
jgi:O-antigen/teichoic acid export membrane protein